MSLLNHLPWMPGLGKRSTRLLSHFVAPAAMQEMPLPSLASLRQSQPVETKLASSRSVMLAFTSVALAAKLAKIDNPVNREEVEAFYQYFPLPREHSRQAAELFYEAHNDPADSRLYARKIVAFYGDNQEILSGLMQSLIKLAAADGPINTPEFCLLKKVADTLHFTEQELLAMLHRLLVPEAACHYAALGIPKQADADAVKKAYRRAAKDYHPDILRQHNLPKEIQAMLQEKFHRMTIAYDTICKKRKFR